MPNFAYSYDTASSLTDGDVSTHAITDFVPDPTIALKFSSSVALRQIKITAPENSKTKMEIDNISFV